ncbi:MAG TPA: hydantoinase B/oxoprolinase family protein [Vicinamibacterales bacterium]|nr:hydantoinase B/oxoprolinase family protein [Vicinamibacterales bacterium]
MTEHAVHPPIQIGSSQANPIEFEIFKNLLVSIPEEMGVTLRRTGFSPNIKERLDYSCAIYNDRGDTIAQGDHMPVHLGAMPLSVASAIAYGQLEPGDAIMLNDPYRGGTHLPDITLVTPIFLDDERQPAFFSASRAHHSDVGGMAAGSMPLAREVFQEGLIIPPVKLLQRGTINRDVMNLLLANVRTPLEREGDVTAQIAANRIGERRLLEAVRKYGRQTVNAYAVGMQEYTERIIQAAIRDLRDGEYRFEDWLDDDGMTTAPQRIAVTVTISGNRAVVDFTGSAPQVAGNVNANYAITLSASLYVFRCLVRGDVPYNAGLGRAIQVIAPEGTVVNARSPAAVAGGNVETSQRITDVLFGALAAAAPDRIPAASQGTMNNVTLGGVDPRSGRPFAYYETIGGGMGARPSADGLSGVHTHMSNTRNTPVEALEHVLPVRVRRYALRRHSGGDGRFRGGDGIIREYELLTETNVTILSERRKGRPYGLAGGNPGQSGTNVLIKNGVEEVLPSKVAFKACEGDRLRIETPGGGGYGPAHPTERSK